MQKAMPALALILLLLLPAASAQKIGNPQLATYASISIDENGSVGAIGGSMRDLRLNLSIPAPRLYQQVQVDDRPYSDADGNSYITIASAASASPLNPFLYSRQIMVQSSGRITEGLPSVYVVPPDLQRFMLPSERTQSGNSKIRQLSMQLVENATTTFEKVARMAIYVHDHITYTDSMVGKEKDALWVLENQQGVCAEYATLFVAMARSVGIPARYVTGYVY